MTPKRWVPMALLAATAIAPAVANAQRLSRVQIEAQLTGYEHEPTVATVSAWGASSVADLEVLADDAREPLAVRARAVHALRAFPNALDVQRWLRAVAIDAGRPVFVRRTALDALCEGFGDVPDVVAALRDRDPQMRDGAAWTLSRSTDPRARAAMQSALATERDPTVRRTLATAQRPAN